MNRLWAIAILILLAAPSVFAATTQPTTQIIPPTLEELKDDKRQQLAAQGRPMGVSAAEPLDQIIHFRISGDSLVVDSPMFRRKTINARIPLKGTPDIATVRISYIRNIPGAHLVNFDVYDFSDPALIDRHLQVLSVRWILEVAEDKDFVDRSESVSLTETLDPGAAAPVTLRVMITPYSDQLTSVNVPYTGESLWGLRCAHPAEVERFMRPMFRDFNQEAAAFAVDDKIAWQVLGDTWVAPQKVVDEVHSILNAFNSDDYTAREAAQKQLEDMGEPGALYLLSTSLTDQTPEQQARVEKFLAPYHLLTDAQVTTFRHDVNFLIDCLYSDDADLRKSALDHLSSAIGSPIQFDPGKSVADRIQNVRRLRDKLSATPGSRP